MCGKSICDADNNKNATPHTFEDAVEQCAAQGARLCTPGELKAGVAKKTGCSLDMKKVWSKDHDVGCGPGPDVVDLVNGSGSAGSGKTDLEE